MSDEEEGPPRYLPSRGANTVEMITGARLMRMMMIHIPVKNQKYDDFYPLSFPGHQGAFPPPATPAHL